MDLIDERSLALCEKVRALHKAMAEVDIGALQLSAEEPGHFSREYVEALRALSDAVAKARFHIQFEFWKHL